MRFDPSAAQSRVDRLWGLPAEFGTERDAERIYLEEIVSDRFALVNGLQVVRDELQLAAPGRSRNADHMLACGADFALPSVCTTLAATSCGDRIHQGETSQTYLRTVAARFASLGETGDLKMEDFAPAGGGTDDGATLAHVTVAHQLDGPLRTRLYEGNASSYVLTAFDLKTHVGRLDHPDGPIQYGLTQESHYREPRTACGAIVGTLHKYNAGNAVHQRILRDLGEESFEFLKKHTIVTPCGTDATYAVAAAIVSVRGMLNTAQALTTELDERGVGHLTALLTVNRPEQHDTLLYLARATVANGEVRVQGLGTDASQYSADFVEYRREKRLVLHYAGHAPNAYPIVTAPYTIRWWGPETAVVDDESF